jgi:glycerate dehydrogenase
MQPLEIVFLDRDSLPVPLPVFDFPHQLTAYAASAAHEVVPRCRTADVVITNKVAFTAPVLAQLPQLKMVAVAATGVNHIDLDACREHQIAVSNVRHYGDESVAEHAFLLMLALSRNLPAYQRDVAAGCWAQSPQFCHFGAPVRELKGACLGLIGSGGIAQALAARARAFGMQVLFAERKGVATPRADYLAFDHVLASADIVSLHCPLTDDTRNLLAAPELARMKPGALLINTARGGLVNESDLLQALKSGSLGGAGFDVLQQEPPRTDDPLLQANLPNLIVTPHIAWASSEAMARLAQQVVDCIAAFAAGKQLNRVV